MRLGRSRVGLGRVKAMISMISYTNKQQVFRFSHQCLACIHT